jgi:phosphocarrier protein HPr
MQRQVEIINKLGLHARPAALFVQCVIRFQSTISIHKDDERYSAASILEVLAANLDCGAKIIIEAVGPDEEEALDQLEALLKRLPEEEDDAGQAAGQANS